MSVSANHANETWHEIERAVESLSVLAKQEVSAEHFHAELVTRLSQMTSAERCTIWGRETRHLDLVDVRSEPAETEFRWLPIKTSDSNQPGRSSTYNKGIEAELARLVAEAAQATKPICLPAGSILAGKAGPRLRHDILLNRVMVGDKAVAVIELAHEGERSVSQREGVSHLLTVAAEITSDFHRNWQLRRLQDREQRREKLDRFLEHIHHTYDLREVAFAIAAEGRELIDCDRLSVIQKKGRRCRVLAISGVDQPDRRSQTVRCIESLVKSRIRDTQPIWFDRAAIGQESPSLKTYFVEANAKHVGLLPIFSTDSVNRSRPQRLGTLLVEVFNDEVTPTDHLLSSRANWLVRHASAALSNSVAVSRLPGLRFSRWVDRRVTRVRSFSWSALLAAILIAAIGYLAWLPTDFQIDARGELIPVRREAIYAPRSGTVTGFPLLDDSANLRERKDGILVQPGDVVAQLESAELDYELTTLLGEQSTVDQQLKTISASIGQLGRSRDAESRSRYDQLTAQAAELRVMQASVAKRIKLINSERESLAIKAGIGGRILTWDVVNSLMLRPVQQGDRLLEIVDVNGPWELDLYVRDRHIGYVTSAQSEASAPLSISFFHRSNPEREYSASVKSIALSTELYPEYGSAVRVVGQIEQSEQLSSLRPGTTVIAKIDCGKKPKAYVWGYDLLHTIRMWALF